MRSPQRSSESETSCALQEQATAERTRADRAEARVDALAPHRGKTTRET